MALAQELEIRLTIHRKLRLRGHLPCLAMIRAVQMTAQDAPNKGGSAIEVGSKKSQSSSEDDCDGHLVSHRRQTFDVSDCKPESAKFIAAKTVM